MTTANVRYISNGYIVDWQGSATIGIPASLFAGSIPEVVYWLGRIFDPVANPSAIRRSNDAPSPSIITPADDPLLGQRATVLDVASGGFLVTQLPTFIGGGGGQLVEVYCPTMDAVADALTAIYTPPPPPEPEA